MTNRAQSDAMVVYVTTPDIEIARLIAAALIEHHEAACVNIVPTVESVYRWQGKVETSTESLLVIKTQSARLTAIDARLAELHPDDVPERIALPIADGAEAYMHWLIEQTV